MIQGVPGIKTGQSFTPRRILASPQGVMFKPGGVIIDGSESRDLGHTGYTDILRAGLLLGKVTANGLYAPTIIGVLAAAFTNGTSLTLTAAQATEIKRRVGSTGSIYLIGGTSDTGTVAIQTCTFSAIDTDTGVLTIGAPGANAAQGSLICAADGSHLPQCIIGDGTGVKVTDDDDSDIDEECGNVLVGGIINWSNICVDASVDFATSVKQWLKDQLANFCKFAYIEE